MTTARPRRSPLRYRSWSWLTAANLLAIVAMVVIDWITPSGVVVGILLALPIFASSMGDDPRERRMMSAIALTGFLLAAVLGDPPISPIAVWGPNRVIALAALLASIHLASTNQRRLTEQRAAHAEAVETGDLNRLLLSLLAHDLRAPLGMGLQALEYVEGALSGGDPIDSSLLHDVRQRLRRTLGTLDRILDMARRDIPSSTPGAPASTVTALEAAAEIETEVRAFAGEARARGHTLAVEVERADERPCHVDTLLIRQATAILVDNAIRHARPGETRVTARLDESLVELRVEDAGHAPPSSTSSSPVEASGSGIGLTLCRTLVARAGGTLEVERSGPDGTSVYLRLPAHGG